MLVKRTTSEVMGLKLLMEGPAQKGMPLTQRAPGTSGTSFVLGRPSSHRAPEKSADHRDVFETGARERRRRSHDKHEAIASACFTFPQCPCIDNNTLDTTNWMRRRPLVVNMCHPSTPSGVDRAREL